MTLSASQGHRVMGKLEPMQSFCCNVAESNQDVNVARLCKAGDGGEVL